MFNILNYLPFIGFFIFLLIIYKNNLYLLIYGLFIYLAFHYSYSLTHEMFYFINYFDYFINSKDGLNDYMIKQNPIYKVILLPENIYSNFQKEQHKIHTLGVGNINKFLLLLVLLILIIKYSKKIFYIFNYNKISLNIIKIFSFSLLFLISSAFYSLLNDEIHGYNINQIIFFYFIIILCLPILLFFIHEDIQKICFKNYHKNILILMLTLMTITSFIEVKFGLSYSHTRTSDGLNIFRANSFFLNANIFATWLAFLYLITVYFKQKLDFSETLYLVLLFMIFLNLFFSGSRGVFYIIIFIESIRIIIGFKNLSNYIPYILILLTFLVVYIVKFLLNKVSISTENLDMLFNRYFESLIYIPSFAIQVLNSIVPITINEQYFSIYLPPEIQVSIDGRKASGLTSDNGWFNLFNRHLPFSFVFISLIIYLKFIVIKIYLKIRSQLLINYFLILLFMTLLGFLLRFDIFPIWIIYSITLIYIYANLSKNFNSV